MSPRSPFSTSTWLALWWRHYSEARLWVRDRFFTHSVRDQQGKLVAIAPLILTERPGSGPLRSAQFVLLRQRQKASPSSAAWSALRNFEGPAVKALLAHLDTIRTEWDWLVWNGVSRDGEAYQTLSSMNDFHWGKETTDYVLKLPSSWEEFRGTRSRNIKESLRKCYNSLKRAGYAFTFRAVSEAGELPSALQRLFEPSRAALTGARPSRARGRLRRESSTPAHARPRGSTIGRASRLPARDRRQGRRFPHRLRAGATSCTCISPASSRPGALTA